MKRTLFEPEHDLFRAAFRAFIEREIAPFHAEWERAGAVPRNLWQAAGRQGFLCMDVPEEYGGAGARDYRFNVVIGEELWRAGATGPGFVLHTDIVVPYITNYGTPEQRQRWLPRCVSGECITAIAMTEPGAGSDLAAIRTTARRDGDAYLLNGQKTFISNGILNDLVIVVAKTDPDAGHRGISLLVVERDMPGYERGRRLEKIGLHAQDTAELFFHNVRVPRDHLLGEEGQGFRYLMEQLPRERLAIAVGAVAAAEAARSADRACVCRSVRAGVEPGRVDCRDRSDGKMVDDRTPAACGSRLFATARRLWLYARISDCTRISGCARPDDLWWNHRDYEGNHRAIA
jgi:alkylation response protein AidB-like acyl-CoA dehydrogenase